MPKRPLRDLSPEEIAAYQREGVICARSLFPPHWVERMAKAADRVVAAPTFMGTVPTRNSSRESSRVLADGKTGTSNSGRVTL